MRIKNMIEMALEFTLKGNNIRQFYLGAIGQRRDGAIVLARNELDMRKNPAIHAEARLAAKLGMNAPLVIVVRHSKLHGGLTMAKPCIHCEKVLALRKARRVLYSDENGNISTLW